MRIYPNRRITHVFLVVLLCGFATESRTEEGVLLPSDSASPTEPGPRGILENSGDRFHNVGNVLMHLTNFGIIGSMPGSRQQFDVAPSAQWPAGSGVEYLWGGGLWVGAVKAGEVGVSAWEITDERLILEFLPGGEEEDRFYETEEHVPGGARIPARNADDDGDELIDEDPLDGRDNDRDGFIDEDHAAISNQMLYCEYRDSDPRILRQAWNHRPLGILVKQTSMAWGNDKLQDAIVFDFTILNEGVEPLSNVYVGFYADFDIGPRGQAISFDDLAGFWEGWRTVKVGNQARNVKVSIGYMFDDDGDEDAAPGYIGIMFIGAHAREQIPARPRPITVPARYRAGHGKGVHNVQMYTRFSSPEFGGRPRTDMQRYAILNGTAPNSLPSASSNVVRSPVVAPRPNDYRIVVSQTPFSRLGAGDSIVTQMAIVMGRGFEDMVENATNVLLAYEGAWWDCDGDPTTGIEGREYPLCTPEFAGYTVWYPTVPNCDELPEGDPRCWRRVPDEGCLWVNADEGWWESNPPLGAPILTGVDGRECFIPWVSPVNPPPPPNFRIAATENRIELFWDNLSERVINPFLEVNNFESYRIWAAENWTRPLGTHTSTGPNTDLWALLAEYDVANGVGSDSGLGHARYEPDVPQSAVDFYLDWYEQHPGLAAPDLPDLTPQQADTARAMAQGVRYYHFVDPPFVRNGVVGGPCSSDSDCKFIRTSQGVVPARCGAEGLCLETVAPPASGAHVFYSLTATVHTLGFMSDGTPFAAGRGSGGLPQSNFQYISPPTDALVESDFHQADQRIYVVPNPATRQSMAAWALRANRDDPTGLKIEFHHLPASRGKISIYTLSGDLVEVIGFDGRSGNGTAHWDLISRNGQFVMSGVYLYTVEAEAAGFKVVTGKFVVIL